MIKKHMCNDNMSRNDLQSRSFRNGAESHNDLPPIREHVKGGKCIICHEPFEGLHLNFKRTCSDACRQTLHRMRTRIDTKDNQMIDGIDFYADCMGIPELRDKAIMKLKAMQAMIEDILSEE